MKSATRLWRSIESSPRCTAFKFTRPIAAVRGQRRTITTRTATIARSDRLPWTIVVLSSATAAAALLWASQKPVQAQEAVGSDEASRLGESLASTLPLDSVGKLQHNLSETNLHDAYLDFVELLGEENVDLRQGERISRSSTEWSPAPNGEADIPSMIVSPRHTQDVSNIAKICHRRRIPMIGFSGGTSLEGTLAAQHKEVCIDFNRHMNQVLELRTDDLDVTVQPSVGYQELNQMLAKHNLFFPPDPGPGAQIGGMIGQGCSGTNAYRYGTMKDWVLGLEVVLADGTIITTRGRARKSSSGYDLTRLFTGSEGTLGFVTKAHLKITTAPQNIRVAVAQFPTIDDAVKLSVTVLQSGHQLEAMELLDAFTMHAINQSGYSDTTWDEKPTLFLKFAGPSASQVAKTAQTTERLARQCNSTLFHLAATDAIADSLWQARKTALWALLAMKTHPSDSFISADTCVPISSLAPTITEAQNLITKANLLGSFLGHVGDGNFHTTVLYSADEKTAAEKVVHDVQRLGCDADGTVSGEHGIGVLYRDQVVYELGAGAVDAMRRVKFALDPLGLMNPGKMIRLESE